MCLLPENEQFAAVDDTAEWATKQARKPEPRLTRLQVWCAVASIRLRMLASDVRVFYSGIDWFDVSTRAAAWLCAFSVLSSLLAIAIAHGWLQLPQLAALLGLPK